MFSFKNWLKLKILLLRGSLSLWLKQIFSRVLTKLLHLRALAMNSTIFLHLRILIRHMFEHRAITIGDGSAHHSSLLSWRILCEIDSWIAWLDVHLAPSSYI